MEHLNGVCEQSATTCLMNTQTYYDLTLDLDIMALRGNVQTSNLSDHTEPKVKAALTLVPLQLSILRSRPGQKRNKDMQ